MDTRWIVFVGPAVYMYAAIVVAIGIRSGYFAAMAKAAKTKPTSTEPESDEVSWTVRMPRALAEQIRAHAEALTAEGRGKWSGNMVITAALAEAAKGWGKK